MMKDLLLSLLDATLSGKQEWMASSNPFEFYTYFDGIRHAIEKKYSPKGEEDIVLSKWNENGDPFTLILNDQFEIERAHLLFDSILKTNDSLNVRYNTYLKKMNEELATNERSNSISLHKVLKRLGYESEEERPFIRIKQSESFYYKDEDAEGFIPLYVHPPMSQIPTTEGMTNYQDAEVILISAPGATGKTAMSNYISFILKIPILNLGKHAAVGANSISGLIMTQVEQSDLFVFHNGLRNGSCSLVIDGLDEASIHITQASFEAFLSDVSFFAKGSKGLPFLILGRPAVMEDAALTLEDKGVKVCLLQIEPFTVAKAVLFIDNQVPKEYSQKYYQQYKEARDYIIAQIGGFFKNESELNTKLFEHFIGYAPVLQSISNLLNDRLDYHKLYDDLKSNKKQNIELLIDIVRRILNREQNKIREEVLPQLFDGNHSAEFKQMIIDRCGDEDEQCKRILGRVLDKNVVINISDDERFNERYNEKVNGWMKNHPFLKGNEKKIQNIVFESYLAAKFIERKQNEKDVLDYLSKSNSGSYLLLDIYSTLNGGETHEISHLFFPYLYKSFKALDQPKDIGFTEIIADEVTGGQIICYLNFCRKEFKTEYDFKFSMNEEDELLLPSPVSAINIDAPISVKLNENRIDVQAPTTITCRSLTIKSKDILFSTPNDLIGSIVFDSQYFNSQCDDGTMPTLIFRTPKENNNYVVITDSKVYHPFTVFTKPRIVASPDEELFFTAYQKLRRMILMFRSNSRGMLARCCSKIDNRIGNTELGKAIISGLIKKGVIDNDGTFYFINYEKFANVLGMKYDDIRSSEINDKVKSFIQSILVK